jgi:hypothetical protein
MGLQLSICRVYMQFSVEKKAGEEREDGLLRVQAKSVK